VNGKEISTEVLTIGMDHEKTLVMGYMKLFDGSGIHHSISGLR